MVKNILGFNNEKGRSYYERPVKAIHNRCLIINNRYLLKKISILSVGR